MTDLVGWAYRVGAAAIAPAAHSPASPTAPRSGSRPPHAPAFRWSRRLVAFAGIDVCVYTTFLLLIMFHAFIACSDLAAGHGVAAMVRGALLMLAVIAAVVLPELGHVLTARRFGVLPRDIEVSPR